MKRRFIKMLSAFLASTMLFATAAQVPAYAVEEKEQVRITEKTPLLNEKGELTQPGYCFTDLYEYKRSDIKANASRIKEWDFYQITNDDFTVQITVADISLGGAVTVGFFDRHTGERASAMVLNLFTFGRFDLGLPKKGLPENDWSDHTYTRQKKNFDFKLDVNDKTRTIKFDGKASGKKFTMDITLDMLPDLESHFIAVPFDKPNGKHFYYNQKTNCMAATGTVVYGDKVYEFKGLEDNSFAVLDWGRGVWPFHQVWWWGNGNTVLPDGRIFGFEIGWGFGNTDAASESTAFIDGKAYKLGYLRLENESEIVKPLDKDWANNGTVWKITSDDGSFEMTMKPEFDNYTMLRFLVVGNLCHQVFGKWSGTVKCGDEVIEIEDMTAFLERSDNMW
ncbi:MAG: DUF2804 domain-containing protein [Clostridia bacterium]|nr:DUF2804 domain-containing protein [Clostridia bacterium]